MQSWRVFVSFSEEDLYRGEEELSPSVESSDLESKDPEPEVLRTVSPFAG